MYADPDQHDLFYEGNGIMEAVREYILSVSAAALICAVISLLPGKQTLSGKAAKIVMGLFMMTVLIQPLGKLSFGSMRWEYDNWMQQAQDAVKSGEDYSYDAISNGISRKIEAYILDKAASVDITVMPHIQLSQDMPPKLLHITLEGDAAPYKKTQLSAIIMNALGLDDEDISWQ